MIDPENVPPVSDDEILARYVLQKSHLRSDNTIRPDAFIPHPYEDLSVTRHRSATIEEIWSFGQKVAQLSGKSLYGRGDILVTNCSTNFLTVKSDPIATDSEVNPNHAIIVGWPKQKSAQKLIAQKISASAAFVAVGG